MADLTITADLTEIVAAGNHLRQFRTETEVMARQARATAGPMSTLNTSAGSLGRTMNRAGVLTQQAGYQVGDFIVQVQSGTNAFVAFGQQATQVAGTLTLLGGKWVAIGSALGVAIPLLTAAGAMWMRTRQQAREAAEGVSDFEEALNSLDDSLQSWLRTMEAARLGLTVDELLGTQGLSQAEQELESARAALELLQRQSEAVMLLGQAPLSDRSTQQDIEDAIARVTAAEERLANLRARQAQEQAQTFAERQVAYEEEIAMLQAVAEHGENSAEVIRLRTDQNIDAELRRIAALRESNEITEGMAVRLTVLAVQSAALTQEAELQAAALQVAREEYDRLEEAASTVVGLDLSSWNAQVARMAELTGLGADEAERYLRALKPLAGMTTGEFFTGEGGLLPPTLGDTRTNIGNTGHIPSGGGGGGSGLNFVETLQREMELRTRLLGLGREEAELQTEIDRITTGLGESRNQYSDEFIANLARQNLALQEQEDLAERLMQTQEDFAQTVSESFGDALMSIIDGTKSTEDAFKAMAATIIRELYDILVVQQLVGSIRDSIGGSNLIGSFFSSMAGRASGGTMNANQPYLVGERGPEIVMPGRQSTVTNANLTRNAASQDSAPVVNMTYNFQGGITEADLARAMPMMVEKTKAAVVDTVQRGGSMARVFR